MFNFKDNKVDEKIAEGIMNYAASKEVQEMYTEITDNLSDEANEAIHDMAVGVAATAYAIGIKDVICKEVKGALVIGGLVVAAKVINKIF